MGNKDWATGQKPSDDEQLILSYLLGDLDQTAREEFEDQYFTDDALFRRLEEMELGLIENYHLGRLTNAEKRRLDKQFRAYPHRREHARLPGALIKRFVPEQAPLPFPRTVRNHRLAVTLVAALVLMTGALVSMVIENAGLRRQIRTLPTSSTLSPTRGSDVGPQQSPAGLVARLQLDASDLNRTRARGEERIFQLRRDALVVELILIFQQPDDRELYSVILRDANGDEQASDNQLKAAVIDGLGRITAVFPAARFAQDSYEIRLNNSRGRTVASFPFGIRIE